MLSVPALCLLENGHYLLCYGNAYCTSLTLEVSVDFITDF